MICLTGTTASWKFNHMVEYQSMQLDAVFKAVSDPTRRAILARLALADARVTDIAKDFPMSLNAVSKHLRVLEGATLVRRTVVGREHVLALNAEAMGEAAGWMDHYRRFWEERLANLDALMTERATKKGNRK
jgi:DNA-binding transcriptional ArsR family regulator